jgi:alkanesulfonate monooxygenase SsuD/methylene tetrahydromethanopterin reductase-like flavin-dependent oxidoreductase (luciferase family)
VYKTQVLGLGASSNVIVEHWNGIPFQRPLTKVAETVDYLRTVLAGERGAGGFKLASPPTKPVPIVLAALRERMLQLAAEKADGVFANFLPLGNVAQVVRAFDRPDKEFACRFFSFHGPEEVALVTAKRSFVAYATVPVYTEFFRWLGRADEVDPIVDAWNAGDRKRALELAPEGLVREIFLLGPIDAQRERLAEFAEAGIQTAVILISGTAAELPDAIDAFRPRTG